MNDDKAELISMFKKMEDKKTNAAVRNLFYQNICDYARELEEQNFKDAGGYYIPREDCEE